MLADAGKKSCLIHLPYGDAWHCDSVRRMTRDDAIRNLDSWAKVPRMGIKKSGPAEDTPAAPSP